MRADQPDGADSLFHQEEERTLCEALAKLSSRERLMIELHFRQGLPAEEVAEILKISGGAVYTQKSRLLEKLRGMLEMTARRKYSLVLQVLMANAAKRRENHQRRKDSPGIFGKLRSSREATA